MFSKILIILPLYFSILQSQTAIVTISMDSVVYIGSDSRIINRNYSGKILTDMDCKIHRQGNIFFAFSGFYRWTNYRGHVQQIAPYLQGALSVIESVIEPKIDIQLAGKVLQEYLKDNPTGTFLDSVLYVELVIILPNDSTWSTYYVRTSIKGIDSTAIIVGKTPPIMLGEKSAMEPIYRSFPNIIDSIGPTDAINYLIASQVARTPFIVGGPISILRIDKNGYEWMQKGQPCPEKLESAEYHFK
jgi:hypothetical protein